MNTIMRNERNFNNNYEFLGPFVPPEANGGSGTSPPNMLEEALACARVGLAVFPIASQTKIPFIPKKKGGNGVYDATRDPETITRWWREYPRASIGVGCGKLSGIVAIDVDGDSGHKTLDAVMGGEPLVSNLVSKSGRRTGPGEHYYFALPEGGCPNHSFGGLEVKSTGLLVVAPPSLHKSGARYEWIVKDGLFGSEPLPPLPKQLYEFATQKQKFEGGELKAIIQPVSPLDMTLFDPEVGKEVAQAFAEAGLKDLPFEEAAGNAPTDPRVVAKALEFIPKPEGYKAAVEVAMMLHAGLGAEGFELLWSWYDGSPEAASKSGLDRDGFAKKWETFRADRDRKLTLGSLFHLAKEHGFDRAEAEAQIAREDAEGRAEKVREGAAVIEAAVAEGKLPPAAAAVLDIAKPFILPGPEEAPGDEVVLVSMEDIEEAPVIWLWYQWLMLAALNILSGVGKVGKSTIAYTLAAIISAGGLFPDGTRAAPGNIIIWSGEDEAATVIKPRLMAAGADMSRIKFIANTLARDKRGKLIKRTFDPSKDMVSLAKAARQFKPVLAIIDPVVSSIGGADTHKSGEVRIALQPVVDFAMEIGCAVLGIHHFSKRASTEDPRNRMSGTHAFGDIARVNLGAAKVVRDVERKTGVLTRLSSNNGPEGGGFAYSLVQKEVRPGIEGQYIDWGDELVGSAWDIISQAEEREENSQDRAMEAAKDFLRVVLSGGDVLCNEVKEQAQEASIKWATLRRAKDALGVRSTKGKFDGKWYWRLPSDEMIEGAGGTT